MILLKQVKTKVNLLDSSTNKECNFNLIQDTPARYHYLFKNEK